MYSAFIRSPWQRFWWRHDPEKQRMLAEKQYWWDMMVYLFQNGALCASAKRREHLCA